MEHKSYTCDRCSQVFIRDKTEDGLRIVTQDDINRLKESDYRDSKTAYIVFKYTTTGLDLCTKCYQELDSWLNAYKTLDDKLGGV